ncbi:sigma 54-interacting transcriptional regulator [Thiocapsa roseopersicina]|uniref:Transcriptional regulator containing GAF, AAA-type ATPase, and DNA-binding Fis domains n=1 Tax=Thiocapsa roseopersicina TaxID=1058 RepID=A0A1H3ASH4_THIRO|nr:sigma 54-interacting transcriptional regulator [Thiocapsa roseopersicina]SDX32690.1 Transcriptional regulator containing GAF, AAA-type ATPase, and DNA-binding Fis domains [Thiocapsa roseopersicina]
MPEASEARFDQEAGASEGARPGGEPGKGVAATELSLAERLAFERLLGDLSARFADLPADQVIDQLRHALDRLTDFLGFDRCSFAEVSDAERPFQVLCSVSKESIEAIAPGPAPPLTWYFGELRAGRVVALADIPADFPPEAVAEIHYCERAGLKSNLAIPLRVGGRVVGAIAFSAFHRTRAWPEDLILRLKLVGEVLAQAVARSRREAALATALAEITHLKERLEAENQCLRQSSRTGCGRLPSSRSPRFNRVLEEIAQVAPTNATVLLLGETGTGKEVLADAIHHLSQRGERPMIKVNCAALPASLIEAELFGREKGAYTGALARQMGRFELADGSTIFLDEVGELPLELQTKLLRVLQDGSFERVGGTRTIKVKIRVIAATNRDLARAVAEGRFRDDLYYRLNVFPVAVPPLRERPEDIPLLAWEFVRELGESMGKSIEHIAPDSMDALMAYAWPGNVRELRNLIERAMILARGSTLHVALGAALSPAMRIRRDEVAETASAGALKDREREQILQSLQQTGWRIRGPGGAAERLGIKPTTLESRMKRLGLKRPTSG